MGQNSSEHEHKSTAKGYKLRILSEEEINHHQYPPQDLWFLVLKGGPIGPFHTQDILKYLEEHPQFNRQCSIASLSNKDWRPIHEVPEFDQRKNALPITELPPGTARSAIKIHLLQQGHKEGPFSLEELWEKLRLRQISYQDLITINGGRSWIKVHQFPDFDRRHWGGAGHKLPAPPAEHILQMSTPPQIASIANVATGQGQVIGQEKEKKERGQEQELEQEQRPGPAVTQGSASLTTARPPHHTLANKEDATAGLIELAFLGRNKNAQQEEQELQHIQQSLETEAEATEEDIDGPFALSYLSDKMKKPIMTGLILLSTAVLIYALGSLYVDWKKQKMLRPLQEKQLSEKKSQHP